MNRHARPPDGSGEPQLLTDGALSGQLASWSPDDVLAFLGADGIMTLTADGTGEPQTFSDTTFREA